MSNEYQTEPDVDSTKFKAPPEWGTYQDGWRGNGMARFRTHTTLGFAKRSIRDTRAGHLYHWDGTKWNWCASYPQQDTVKG